MLSTVTFCNDMKSSTKLVHVGSSNSGQARLTPDIDLPANNARVIEETNMKVTCKDISITDKRFTTISKHFKIIHVMDY